MEDYRALSDMFPAVAYGTLVIVLIVFRLIISKRDKRVYDIERPVRDIESYVHEILTTLPSEYYVLSDVWFAGNGRSTQIDHIVVSPYGVFVIETKGHKGWIVGGEYSEYWKRYIHGYVKEFYNPILQNNAHVRFLSYLLSGMSELNFIPVVVFNDEAQIRVLTQEYNVVNCQFLLTVIRQYETVVMSEDLKNRVIDQLNRNRKTGTEIERLHITYVKEKVKISEVNMQNGICPRCRGYIIEREGPYGSFYGCSNYPDCRFTIKR